MGKRKVPAHIEPLALAARKSNLQAKQPNGSQADNRPKKLKQLLYENFNENLENHWKMKPNGVKTLPVQRILNGESGKNVQTMQPLMSMDRELCPTMTESEEESVEELKGNRAKTPNVAAFNKPRNFPEQKFKQKDLQSITHCQVNGNIVKQVTYYDTWYVIRPKIFPAETRQQRHHLELPLVKLANAAKHMKLPTESWSSKVTLYKVAPAVLQRHTLTIFTGDLKVHKIPERERHKYQPSCVIFRRELPPEERNKCHVPYDRVIIFKHKQYTVNFDGKLVNLTGAPEAVTSLQDVQKLLDILECITLSHSMIEIVTPK